MPTVTWRVNAGGAAWLQDRMKRLRGCPDEAGGGRGGGGSAGSSGWGIRAGPALASSPSSFSPWGVGAGIPRQTRGSLGWAVAMVIAPAACAAPDPSELRLLPPAPLPEPAGR